MGKCSTKVLVRVTVLCLVLLFLSLLFHLLFGTSLTYAGFRIVGFLGLAWVACETVYRISTLYER